jgi:hypothetical protein
MLKTMPLATLESRLLFAPIESITQADIAALYAEADNIVAAFHARRDADFQKWKNAAARVKPESPRNPATVRFQAKHPRPKAAPSPVAPFDKIGAELERLAGDLSGLTHNVLPQPEQRDRQ